MPIFSMRAVGLAFLAPLSILLPSDAAYGQACSIAQKDISDAFYDSSGHKRPGATGQTPKFCPPREQYPTYECPKRGFDAAALFLQQNKAALVRAAELAQGIYDSNFSASSYRIISQTAAQQYLLLAADSDAGATIVAVEAVAVPRPGQTLTYLHRSSGSIFSLTMDPPSKSGKDMLFVAFKGSENESPTRDAEWIGNNLPQQADLMSPMYAHAEAMSQNLAKLLISQGAGCSTNIVWTGHSLGGGQALFAGMAHGLRCSQRKGDSIVLFNPARPPTENARHLAMMRPSVNLIVDITAKDDFIYVNQPRRSRDAIEWMFESAQVIRFTGKEIGGEPSRLLATAARSADYAVSKLFGGHSGGETYVVPGTFVKQATAHKMERLRQAFFDGMLEQVPPEPLVLPGNVAAAACDWYTPLRRQGNVLSGRGY